ncbi:hypothetical protein [Rhodococcus aetherivorans]|uniref:hypothetical protein n=1 Tax=Rhodococcus aetherivorans TaxID=191292 RepID=UPI003661A95A
MVFEVKATHRETSTGFAACEVHPDVFVDEWGRVFATAESRVEDAGTVAIQEIRPEDDDHVFVVDDDAIECAVAWIEVLSGWQAERLLEQRIQRRWAASSETFPRIRPDIDRASPRGDRRTVAFDVRASHRLPSGGELACEIYPDVFVTTRSRGVLSRWAGMAMQQPGDIVDALPDDTQEWFRVHGLDHAVDWVGTIAGFHDDFWRKHHGSRETFDRSPVGPMGPSCPPRRRLAP